MSAEVVNLRRIRKAKGRADQAAAAAVNRAKFGRTAADKQIQAASERSAARRFEGHRLDPASPGDDG